MSEPFWHWRGSEGGRDEADAVSTKGCGMTALDEMTGLYFDRSREWRVPRDLWEAARNELDEKGQLFTFEDIAEPHFAYRDVCAMPEETKRQG